MIMNVEEEELRPQSSAGVGLYVLIIAAWPAESMRTEVVSRGK